MSANWRYVCTYVCVYVCVGERGEVWGREGMYLCVKEREGRYLCVGRGGNEVYLYVCDKIQVFGHTFVAV